MRLAVFGDVHATLDTPESWTYVMNTFDALCSFQFQQTRICFCGHTHMPGFFIEDGKVEKSPGPPIRIQPEKKYLINVGSVGQPRDGDWRACYAIYDPAACSISIRRVEYDLGTTQRKIIDAGLPPSPGS